MYWYTILEAGNIGPEGRDDTETENRILPDPRDSNNRFITRLYTNSSYNPTIVSMKLNRRPRSVVELFNHLTGWWHGAILSVAMLTVVHCYTYIVCCCFFEWKIRDSR